jgi:glycosyltransferase involved in cell wall biosynthesis
LGFVSHEQWLTPRPKWLLITTQSSPLPKPHRRVLFVQITEAGGYPPIINASRVMALAGWEVMILNAPIAGHNLRVPPHPRISMQSISERSSHVLRPRDLLRYVGAAARAATTFRPDVVYASDPFAAGPALIAAKLAGATLVYHEHDTPNPGSLNPRIASLRVRAARKATLVVFPNAARAKIAQQELGFRDDQMRIVWNVPRRDEVPDREVATCLPLELHYHGNISPQLLPESAIDALQICTRPWRLRVIGYESPGSSGYALRLVERGGQWGGPRVVYSGQVSRDRLLAEATQASVGLALLPTCAGDVNLTHIIGASNKVFDYMAAGLALLVPNLPDWIQFVESGLGRACNPADVHSISAQLDWFAEHPEECRAMGETGRRKIEQEWNYEQAFQPVLLVLDEATRPARIAAE